MPLVILPAGLSELGTAEPLEQGVLKQPPVIMADGVNEGTKDFASMVYGADPIDEQVWLALNVLRGSGAAVMAVGQRFQDIRKMTDNVATLVEQEARTALARLIQNGDITIEQISVVADSAGNWAECQVNYINQRLPKPTKRTVKAPLRPEVTSS